VTDSHHGNTKEELLEKYGESNSAELSQKCLNVSRIVLEYNKVYKKFKIQTI